MAYEVMSNADDIACSAPSQEYHHRSSWANMPVLLQYSPFSRLRTWWCPRTGSSR
jgi:hypothetical protein